MYFVILIALACLAFLFKHLSKSQIISFELANAAIASEAKLLEENEIYTSAFTKGVAPLFIKKSNGEYVKTSSLYAGQAASNSCEPFGIKKGQRYFADYLDELGVNSLKDGDVLIIDAPAKNSPIIKKRIRVFKAYKDDKVVFYDTMLNGQIITHSVRAKHEVLAKITHLVN